MISCFSGKNGGLNIRAAKGLKNRLAPARASGMIGGSLN